MGFENVLAFERKMEDIFDSNLIPPIKHKNVTKHRRVVKTGKVVDYLILSLRGKLSKEGERWAQLHEDFARIFNHPDLVDAIWSFNTRRGGSIETVKSELLRRIQNNQSLIEEIVFKSKNDDIIESFSRTIEDPGLWPKFVSDNIKPIVDKMFIPSKALSEVSS